MFFIVSFTVPYRFYRFKRHYPYRFYQPSINQKPLSVQNDTDHLSVSAGVCLPLGRSRFQIPSKEIIIDFE